MEGRTRIALRFLRDHPDESAQLLERLPALQAAALLVEAGAGIAGGVLRRTAPPVALACLRALPRELSAEIAGAVPPGSAAALLRGLEPEERSDLLSRLAPEGAEAIERLLRHPEGTAGALMDPRVAALPADGSVARAVEWIRQSHEAGIYYLYVVDRAQRLLGVLSFRDLLTASPDTRLAEIMHPVVASVPASTALDAVTDHPAWRSFPSLPVVDDNGALVGVIRVEALREAERERRAGAHVPGAPGPPLALAETVWVGLSRALEGVVGVGGPARHADATPDAKAGGSRER